MSHLGQNFALFLYTYVGLPPKLKCVVDSSLSNLYNSDELIITKFGVSFQYQVNFSSMLRARYSALLQESFYRTKLILFHIFLSYREVFNISSALTNASNTYHKSVSMKITTFMRLFDCCGGVRGGAWGRFF